MNASDALFATGEPNFYLGLAVAAGLGALIGLEREHHRDKVVIAGVRTFPLFATAGYLLAVLGLAMQTPWLLASGTLAMGAVAVTFMVVRHQLGSTGLTTPAAMVVTFAIGAMVAFGYVQEAVVVGLGVTFLLLTKERLHRFAHVLGDEEMLGALQFLAILFILFPLALGMERIPWLPFVGPGEVIDPPALLVLVLFVSGISFVSFLVMRQVGPRRGLEFSGFLGGLVNSEATATSLATHATENREFLRAATAGILLATTTMFVRNLAIAAFADRSLDTLWFMLLPCVAMAGVATWFVLRERKGHVMKAGARVHVRNPFALGPATKFAILFAVLSVVSTLAQRWLGDVGVYAIALGGFVSAGAAVASVAALHASGDVTLAVAGTTAVLATVIGALNKVVVVRAFAPELLERLKRPAVVLSVVGLATLLVVVATYALGSVPRA